MNIMILFSMILFHIIDDYYLQGILAKLKQKSWWKEELTKINVSLEKSKYKNDYIVGLVMHSFSWSFMVHIPIMIFIGYTSWLLPVSIIVNAIIHGITDDQKANRFRLNLVQDQTIHMVQLAVTFILFMWVF